MGDVEGTAEGVVDGNRVSLPLKFTPVGDEGVWAAWGQVPEEGNWVLAIHGTDGISKAEVSILAALADGNSTVRMRAGFSLRAVLTSLFPYRRFDLRTTGYSYAATPERNRAAIAAVRAVAAEV